MARKGSVLTIQGRNREAKITNTRLKGEGERAFCSISTLAARRMVVSWRVAYAAKKGKDLVARKGKIMGFKTRGWRKQFLRKRESLSEYLIIDPEASREERIKGGEEEVDDDEGVANSST